MRRTAKWAAAFLVAALLFFVATLPAAPVRLSLDHVDPNLRARTVAGAYHVHTTRSDGAGDKPSVAQAAARAGLQFVIFTDHGDGTRAPDPPQYLHGVLCIDGVEISTNGGHYVALGLPATPYPLGGEAAAVVEDVARLGGFGIAAHPDHQRPALAWRDWTAPIDGIEWLNADAEWRDESAGRLARLALAYFVQPGPAMASTFDRPSATLDRWDQLSRRRRVVALAAVDAHGGARTRAEDEGPARAGLGPSYDASFGAVSNRVLLDRPFTRDAAQDASLLLAAIRRGDVYSVVDALSPDAVLNVGAPVLTWTSPPELPTSFEPIADGEQQRLEVNAERAPGHPPVPWILTNWLGPAPVAPLPAVPSLGQPVPLTVASAWRVENDPESSGRVSGAESLVTLDFRLAGGERRSQFVAAAADLNVQGSFDTLAFRTHASQPMRVSVQLRFRPDDRRWIKSIYLDVEERDVTIALKDMRYADPGDAPMPSLGTARSLLLLVDLVNSVPGASGSFTISNLRATSSEAR